MTRNKISKFFIFVASFLVALVVVATSTNVYAAQNTVYVKNEVVEANDSGLVMIELVGEGKANDNVEIFVHTEGATAIPGLDYVSINTLCRAKYDSSGKLSYPLSIKTLVTAESREKLRTYDDSNTYGRYFKFVIEKANNASVVDGKDEAKCYLPYSFKTKVITGNKQDSAEHLNEDYAYIEEYGIPQSQYNKGIDDLDGKSTWYSWKKGMTFNNDRSSNWINTFINQGLASAYGTFFSKRCYEAESVWSAWKASRTNIFLQYGNKQFVDTYTSDYTGKKNTPGLALYLETEPQEPVNTAPFYNPIPDWDPRGERITPWAMKRILVDGKNPYDEDDHKHEIYRDVVDIKAETLKYSWIAQENTWFANKNAAVTSGVLKIDPYNGILDTGVAAFNNNNEYDRTFEEVYQYLFLVDTKTPEILGEYIDDSTLKETGKLRIYIRFNEPVMSSRTNESLTVFFNGGTKQYYADYVEGNYTDTLVYEVEPPKDNIRDVKYQFPTDNIGDLACNADEYRVIRNNRLSRDITDKDRQLTFLNGAVNLLTPTLSVDQNSSSNPNNIYNLLLSINENGERDIKDAKLYYTWDKNEDMLKEGTDTPLSEAELANPTIYKNSHEFTPEENGSLALTLVKNEADGIDNGTYYLHAFVTSGYGLTDVKTFGGYNLDGDPPAANQRHPEPNNLTDKTYILDLTNKATGVMNIFVKLKYNDKDGNSKEQLIQIIKNGEKESSIKDRITIEAGAENTIYKYSSNINDDVIKKIMNDNGYSRIEFDVSFSIEDMAGNKATTNIIKAVYDIRDLFTTVLDVPVAHDDVKGYTKIEDIEYVTVGVYDLKTIGDTADTKDIYITVNDDNAKTNYINKGAVFSVVINGKTTVNAGTDGDNRYKVTLTNLEPGYYDIVPKITGSVDGNNVDMVANNIQFYITNNKQDETLNKENISTDLVLTNKVFQLQDQRYYYLDQSGSTVISYAYGATYDETLNKAEGGSTYPSFSNVDEAKKYVRYMELQDLYLIKVTPSIASLLNSGTATTAYVKANGETVNAQEGQLWIRYKKNIWENTATAYGWAYYYYGNGNVEDGININALPTNLVNAMNEVVNRITSKGKTVYLVEESSINQKTGAPYLASSQIHSTLEEATKSKVGSNFISVAKYDGDKNLYKNTVKIKIGTEEKEYALATNMTIRATASTRLFYVYEPLDDGSPKAWKELSAQDGASLSELLPNHASGPYLLREYGDSGVSEYYIYYDKTIPAINVLSGNEPMTLDGTVLSLSTDSFVIKGFASSTDYPAEVDDLAYIAIYSYPGKQLQEVLYASDFANGGDKKLEEKNYYIQVGDRSGNIATYAVLLSNSDLVVEAYENDSKTNITVKVYDRAESEIYSYEVYCNEVLVTTEYAEVKTFKEPGIYRIRVIDIYGKDVTKTIEFAFEIPKINWYYLTSDDTYRKYDENDIVRMAIYDDENNSRITNVYTSAMIKLSFEQEYGADPIKFEVLDLNSDEYTYSEATDTITVNKLAGFRIRVWFESLPQNDHTFIIKVDNEAPQVTASYVGTSFSYYVEYDENNKVTKTASFDNIDLTNYNDGDILCLDTLAYVPGSTSEGSFTDGAVINGGHIVLEFFDPSKIKTFSITRNGQKIDMELDNNQKLIINNSGYYEITISDMLGNIRKFTFTNTSDQITSATIDDEILSDSQKSYGHDSIIVKALYPGDTKILIDAPEGRKTIIFNYDGKMIKYGYYICKVEQVQNDDGQIVEVKTVIFQENEDFYLDLTSDNIREKNWYSAITADSYEISIMVEDGKPVLKLEVKELEDNCPTINVEMLYYVGNTVFPSYYIASLSKEVPDVKLYSGDMEVVITEGAKYIYVADVITIDKNLNQNIVSIEYGYAETSNINDLKFLFKDGEFIEEFEGIEEGFYRIVVKNIFNNQTEYLICKVDSFKTIIDVTYIDGQTNEFLLDDHIIYSNSLITFNVYAESASFEIDGVKYDGIYDSGIITLDVYKQGEHTVTVIGPNNVREEFNIVINTDLEFTFKEDWLTGYTENALLKDQGYTSTPLTAIKAEGVEYIAYKYADNEIKVLYDNISEEKITEIDLTKAIGNDGNGDYIIYFRNIYGDVGTKTIHYSNTPALALSRKTVAKSNAFEKYDLEKAIEEDFYSNYILKFETSSMRYEFRIDGVMVSLDEPKTIEFSNSSGNGSFGYQISYLDEYGNYLEFRAELFRTDISMDTSLMKEILVENKVYTKNNIIVMFADDLEGYVSVENGDFVPYEAGTTFYKDGRYEFIVEDIAGNRATYVVNHKSINHYTLTNVATGQQVIIGSVINDASVAYAATDDSKITKVFKNGDLVPDYDMKTFTTSGHWEIIISDSVGNESYAGFYIVNNALISFDYQAPFDYEITEVWHTLENGQKESIEVEAGKPISLTENGDYAIVVSALNSTSTFNFTVTIDDAVPTATLVGVEDGGVTARDVSLKGLKSGDVVEIYKNGELISITDVSSANTVPEITTGGEYRVVIRAVSGAMVEYNFTRKSIANTATSIFIIIACFAAIAGIGIGLLYHTKIKSDSEK